MPQMVYALLILVYCCVIVDMVASHPTSLFPPEQTLPQNLQESCCIFHLTRWLAEQQMIRSGHFVLDTKR